LKGAFVSNDALRYEMKRLQRGLWKTNDNYPLYTALLSGSRWIGNPINHSSTTVSVSPSNLRAHVFHHMRFSEST